MNNIERTLGRVEEKIDSLTQTVKEDVCVKIKEQDLRIGKVEKRQYMFIGGTATLSAFIGVVWFSIKGMFSS